MKILVLQLARLGDIYLTWPTINAVRRQFPNAEIDLMVRKKFSGATVGLESVDQVLELDTAEIFKWIIEGNVNIDRALLEVDKLVAEVKSNNYTNIINLSYSPFSSYFAKAVSQPKTQVMGYTRFKDGFLSIPDDASAYFYGQVGIDKDNRAHLCDVFASVAGVELIKEDWGPPLIESRFPRPKGDYIVLQPGASEEHKSYPFERWVNVIHSILRMNRDYKVVLIGGPDDISLGESIESHIDSSYLQNWIGKTEICELFPLIGGAQLFIGGDSVGVHIATMTNTPTLNLSFQGVKFWETGPRAERSRVLWARTGRDLTSDRVSEEVFAMLDGATTSHPCIFRQESLYEGYRVEGYGDSTFNWQLVKALYMGEEFPVPTEESTFIGFKHLNELAGMACEQIELVRDPEKRATAIQFLDQAELIIENVEKMAPTLGPIVRWFKTEKLRIPPGNFEEIVNRTYDIYSQLKVVSGLYVVNTTSQEESQDANK